MAITDIDVKFNTAAVDDLAIVEAADDLVIIADSPAAPAIDDLDSKLIPFLMLGVVTLISMAVLAAFLAL